MPTIHSAAGILSNRVRLLHSHRVNAFPIHAVDQREPLSRVEPNPAMPDVWPEKLRFLKTLRIKHGACPIPPYDFNSVGSLGTENIKRAIEWIAASVADQGESTVDTFSKINWKT